MKERKDLNYIYSQLNRMDNDFTFDYFKSQYNDNTPEEHVVSKAYLKQIFRECLTKNNFITKTGFTGKNGRAKIYKFNKQYINMNLWRDAVETFREGVRNQTNHTNKKLRAKKAKKSKCNIVESFSPTKRVNPNKQMIESYFIDIVKSHLRDKKISCFSITGPDYKRHVNKLFDSFAINLHILDNSYEVTSKLLEISKNCPHMKDGNVTITMGDAEKIIFGCQYIDLDLLSGISYVAPIVKSYANAQKRNPERKYLTFTFSQRNDGGEENRFKLLKNLIKETFNCDIEGYDSCQSPHASTSQSIFCREVKFKIMNYGDVYSLNGFSYSDKHGPMMSILVVYD